MAKHYLHLKQGLEVYIPPTGGVYGMSLSQFCVLDPTNNQWTHMSWQDPSRRSMLQAKGRKARFLTRYKNQG